MSVRLWPKKMARETVSAARIGERVAAMTARSERRKMMTSRFQMGQFWVGIRSCCCALHDREAVNMWIGLLCLYVQGDRLDHPRAGEPAEWYPSYHTSN